jgi:hypothetical protein
MRSELLRWFWNQRLDALATEIARGRRRRRMQRNTTPRPGIHAHTEGRHMDIAHQIDAIDRSVGGNP